MRNLRYKLGLFLKNLKYSFSIDFWENYGRVRQENRELKGFIQEHAKKFDEVVMIKETKKNASKMSKKKK